MEAQRITFAFKSRAGGAEISPARVPLGDLVRFAEDVQGFLRGESKEVDTQALDVALRNGSLAIVTAPIQVAPRLFSDLRALQAGEVLDGLDVKRREVVERWQKAAQQSGHPVSYRIEAPFLGRAVHVSSDTDYRTDDADQWVVVERYVRGEIQDLGGITKANAHVRLPDGTLMKVSTDKDLLRNDQANRLYKAAMLRIKAEFNVATGALRNARLLQFVEYASEVRDSDMARMIERGTAAWKDVPDPVAWVEDLRGGSH